MKYILVLILYCFYFNLAAGQVADTSSRVRDTVTIAPKPPIPVVERLLRDNVFINHTSMPAALAVRIKRQNNQDIIFFILTGVILFFGIARAAYPRYFSNLFRVFFNSSLRQGQLTDQLVQDQFPSLIFNILFTVSGGLYFYFLIQYFKFTGRNLDPELMAVCVLGVAGVYLVKYLVLKFTGWITGYRQEAETYTFIIFLINKIIGICLLPVIVVLAFSGYRVANIFVIISFSLVGLFLLMRFVRSFGLLQNKIKVSRFHFFLYIFSAEVLPLFIIYKAVLLFFNRSM